MHIDSLTPQELRQLLAVQPWYRGPISGGEDPPAGAPAGAPGAAPGGTTAEPGGQPGEPGGQPPSPGQQPGARRFWGPGQHPLLDQPPAPGQQPPPAPGQTPPGQPAGQEPAPGQQPGQPPNPFGQQPGQQPPPMPGQTPPPAAQPPQPEVLDFSGRQVQITPDTDPALAQALRSLYGDWREQQATITRLTRGQRQQPQQQPQQPGQPAPQPAQQPPAQPQPLDVGQLVSQALSQVDAEQFTAQLYEDGPKALGAVLTPVLAQLAGQIQQQVQQVAQQQPQQGLAPEYQEWIEQQRAAESYNQQLEQMTTRPDLYPGMDDPNLRQMMYHVLAADPSLYERPDTMYHAYRIARGYMGGQAQPAAQPQPLTVDTVLSNQELVQQLLADQRVRDPIIRSYVDSLRTGGQPPPLIGAGGVSGQTPATPPNRPRSIAEASQAFRAQLGL